MQIPNQSNYHPHELICPSCGGNNLHHGAVTVYERDKEDAPNGRITSTAHAPIEHENAIP